MKKKYLNIVLMLFIILTFIIIIYIMNNNQKTEIKINTDFQAKNSSIWWWNWLIKSSDIIKEFWEE